jgi:ubiquinone biosynthesis protein UbiJ
MKRLLEKALNRYLALDPESKRRIACLNNKKVTIELLHTPLIVQLNFVNETIHVNWQATCNADIIIKGTPLNLLQLSVTPSAKRQRFFAEDVSVEGNMELAQSVLAIFDELEIDWEEFISEWLGDVSAHQLGRFARGIKGFGQRMRRTLARNVNEYVHEEINLFPPTDALQDFFHEVDELRMDLDRLEARTDSLSGKIK